MGPKVRRLSAVALIALMTIFSVIVYAAPQVPHQFYGQVTIDGLPAPDGTLVEARIDGVTYAETPTVGGRYGYEPMFQVPADDPGTTVVEGGVNGDTVKFYVDGLWAVNHAFLSGEITELPLEPTIPFEIFLVDGWNLIGLPCIPEDPSIEVVLADILDNVKSVWTFDGETGIWSSYSPGAPSDLTEMVEGKGYWIKMTADKILRIYGSGTGGGTIIVKVPLLDGETVKIGVIVPSTTTLETIVPLFNQIIKPDINAYCAKLGYDVNFEFLIEDAVAEADIHLEKVQAFHEMGVNLIIGGGWSAQAAGSLGYCNVNDMLMFSPSSTSPLLAIPNDNLFRMAPTDLKQAPAIAEMLWNYGIKAVVFMQRGDIWADGIYNEFVPLFEAKGGVVLDRIRYAYEVTEFSSYLQVAEDAAAAAIPTYGADRVAVELLSFQEAVTIVTQAEDYPTIYSLPWFGGDGTAFIQQLIDDAPTQAAHLGIYSTLATAPQSQKYSDLYDRYYAITSQPLGIYNANYYDIAWAIAKAVLESQSTRGTDVIPLIPQICYDLWGASGWCRLDQNGDRYEANYDIWGYGGSPVQNVHYGYYNGVNGQVTWDTAALGFTPKGP